TAEGDVIARLREEPGPVLQEVIAALDAWMLERRQKRREAGWRRLARVAERLDCSQRRRQLRALLTEGARPGAEGVGGRVGGGAPWAAGGDRARGGDWRGLGELGGRVALAPEPVLSLVLLARVCSDRGDPAGAEVVLRRAVNVRRNEVVLLDALGRL